MFINRIIIYGIVQIVPGSEKLIHNIESGKRDETPHLRVYQKQVKREQRQLHKTMYTGR